MKHLKIGFVLDDSLDKTDGVQQYVLALGAWLSGQGHEVHYLVGQTVRTDLPHVHSLSRNMNVRFNGNRMSMPLPASRLAIREVLEHEQFDVLHVQMPYSPFLAGRIILAAPPQTKIIGTFHILPNSWLVRVANAVLRMLVWRSLRRFSEVFAVSSAAERFMRETYGLHGTVLPNVVDVSRFSRSIVRSEYDDTTPTIMFLGRLVPRKGCATLLDAVRLLRAKQPDLAFRVVICGKGPLEESLKEFVVTQNLDDVVEFSGYIAENDKPSYVASANIMVFPSLGGESFGIVILEGIAAGRPVVLAANNPGYGSVLGGRPELLFAPGNASELAEKIAHYLQDPTARTNVIAWQKEYVRQFDVEVVGRKLVETYKRSLA